jgi:hypothetical protein
MLPSAEQPRDRRTTVALLLAGQAILLTFFVGLIFEVWHRDLRVPLQFSRDALEYLVQAKGTLENGWWWSHPRLSAPFSFHQISYPSNSNVDQLVILLVGLFTHDVGLCVNISWTIFVVASGVVTTLCLRRLGVSNRAAFVAGSLFALSPYALWRSTGHLALVTYLVPIPSAAAILIATNRMDRLWHRSTLPFVIGCALLGFDYIYYAFFGCFVILVASGIAAAENRRAPAWRTGLAIVAIMTLSGLVNLAPSFVEWQREGKPLAIQDKLVAESESHGLKLRHLVGPVGSPDLGLFTRWSYLEESARFPLEGESITDRLGIVGTAGFFAIMWWLLVRGTKRDDERAKVQSATAQLTCATVLLGTVGGVGSLFSLLLSSDIRAYNRVFPFIDFFCLLAVALLLDSAADRRWWSRRPPRMMLVATYLLLLGVWDQSHAAQYSKSFYETERTELIALKSVIGNLEGRLPPGAMIFQLPVESFPSDEGLGKTLPYDQAKPYLVSQTLRWSFPAFADGLAKWQREVAAMPAKQIGPAIRAAGFSAILVDRRGFDDDARELTEELRRERPGSTLVENSRYVAFDVRDVTFDEGTTAMPKPSSEAHPASPGLTWCPGASAFSIDRIGSVILPFNRLPVQAPLLGDITVTGWAVDIRAKTPARDVDVVMGGKVYPAFYGMIRQDVSRSLNTPGYRYVGFTTRIPRRDLRSGVTKLSIRVVAASGDCYYETNPIPVAVP